MPAHYVWDESKKLGDMLRSGLADLRASRHKLGDVLGAMNQMTSAEIVAVFGFADTTAAAAAKSELSTDIGNLLAGSAPGNAIQQMIDQFS